MANRSTQLSRFALLILVSTLTLSFLTGLGLWYIHEQREKLADLPRWTSVCQSIHGLLNPLICIFLGFMISHIVGGWKMRANRKTGSLVTGSVAVLVLTGAAIYYSEHRHFYFTLHLLTGLLLPILLVAHWVQARRWVKRL